MRNICIRIFTFLAIFMSALDSVRGQEALDLSPAHWIWHPSERVLQNTMVLFRKEFNLDNAPDSAKGWILADSRYQLFVNGHRVQWGPAPYDPRWPEADPVDISSFLHEGRNVIACQVLYYGMGEGTWPMGKPGLIMNVNVDGRRILSDESWKSCVPRSWQPGQYKRSFLRTFQECFDANLFPYGWDSADFRETDDWLPVSVSSTPASLPSICAWFGEYMWEISGDPSDAEIRKRSIPMMKETDVPVDRLVESAWIEWKHPCEDYFDMLVPDSYESEWGQLAHETSKGVWQVDRSPGKTAAVTFEFEEQGVGWPYFTIDAPEGTIVELLVHEAHQPGGPALLNTHFNAWSRFVCKEGINHFETFDFESFKWLQLHIRNNSRPVTVSNIGMRRRIYDFPATPDITVSDTSLSRLFDACVNTLYNSAQETIVDGMARERQQYSGDGGHQIHAIMQVLGETRLPNRYIRTFSQGLSLDGYFMDSWPAFDRLARIAERQMHLTGWGPILDHSVGFCMDNYNYYRFTGDLKGLEESYPRLLVFYEYLKRLRGADDLLPVENIGTPSVWIDHEAFRAQKHKQCAFNLYASAMCLKSLSPLCEAFGDMEASEDIRNFGKSLLDATIQKYWDPEQKVFVDNLPWLDTEGEACHSDRSLAMAILFDLCPNGEDEECIRMLADDRDEVSFSYPCNAVWPLWALAKAGRIDVVLKDLREKWAVMPSVRLNNTIQEFWKTEPDSRSQWSHCAVGPLIILYQGIAGILPLDPGYERTSIFPQPGDLTDLELDVQTPKGPIHFCTKGRYGRRDLYLEIPDKMVAELKLDSREKINSRDAKPIRKMEDKTIYELSGGTYKFRLKYL